MFLQVHTKCFSSVSVLKKKTCLKKNKLPGLETKKQNTNNTQWALSVLRCDLVFCTSGACGFVILTVWWYQKKKKNLLACNILAIQTLPYNQTCWVTIPTTIQQQPQVKTQDQMVGPLGFRRFTRHLPFMVELINGLDMQQYASNLLERQRMDGERINQFWGHPQFYWGHQINGLAFWTMGPMTCA